MIPKKIHYCWFGYGEYPEIFAKCRESWSRFCPDYEVIEWNESNFDINITQYVKEAYEAKKWAFVVDYVRMHILYTEGGIYLETDTEIIKPLDELLDTGAFVGLAGKVVTFPVLGMEKGHQFGKAMMDYYSNRHFVKEDGSYDETTINCIGNSILTSEFNMKRLDTIQCLKDNLKVYPERYFFTDWSTGKMVYTESNYVIHYAEASWQDKQLRMRKMLGRKYKPILGQKLGSLLAFIVSYLKCKGVKSAIKGVWCKLIKHQVCN